MEVKRKRDPVDVDPWIIAEVFNRIDTMSDKDVLEWVNNQYHSTYRDDFGNPKKYNKNITWVKSVKTRKSIIDKEQRNINEKINWLKVAGASDIRSFRVETTTTTDIGN